MPWKAAPTEDPFAAGPAGERPRAARAEPADDSRPAGVTALLSQLGMGWVVVLAALAVGAVLVAALVYQPMMPLR
jgi:hypothetical protein